MTNGALPRKGRLTVSWTKTGMLTTKRKKKTKKRHNKLDIITSLVQSSSSEYVEPIIRKPHVVIGR